MGRHNGQGHPNLKALGAIYSRSDIVFRPLASLQSFPIGTAQFEC